MIIALLTDFGTKDPYAGIMKAVISGICPEAKIIDLTHEIEPYEVVSASYVLYSSWNYFPTGTIFLSVIDPGVGSNRRELVAVSQSKSVITPDNGTISLLYRMNKDLIAYRAGKSLLEELKASRPAYSHTFDGRDLFAPLAAIAAESGLSNIVGERVEPVLLTEIESKITEGRVSGRVIHIDRFGNSITSIHIEDIKEKNTYASRASVFIYGRKKGQILKIHRSFSDVKIGEALAYWGSSGFLEIAVRNGNASQLLKLGLRDMVELEL